MGSRSLSSPLHSDPHPRQALVGGSSAVLGLRPDGSCVVGRSPEATLRGFSRGPRGAGERQVGDSRTDWHSQGSRPLGRPTWGERGESLWPLPRLSRPAPVSRSRSISGASSGLSTSPLSSPRVSDLPAKRTGRGGSAALGRGSRPGPACCWGHRVAAAVANCTFFCSVLFVFSCVICFLLWQTLLPPHPHLPVPAGPAWGPWLLSGPPGAVCACGGAAGGRVHG